MDENKQLVKDFENAAFTEHDVEKALSFLADDYKQHNPYFADGKAGFEAGLKWLIGENPNLTSEIKRIFAEGDHVVIHKYAVLKPDQNEGKKAIIDIFRIENGKIAEHWDVIEDIPEEPKNDNTMF